MLMLFSLHFRAFNYSYLFFRLFFVFTLFLIFSNFAFSSFDQTFEHESGNQVALFNGDLCSDPDIICVDDTFGPTQEARPSGGFYDKIQKCADDVSMVSNAGVVVFSVPAFD